jgi:hypothetical protein
LQARQVQDVADGFGPRGKLCIVPPRKILEHFPATPRLAIAALRFWGSGKSRGVVPHEVMEPLRIDVYASTDSHKGIGETALLRVSMAPSRGVRAFERQTGRAHLVGLRQGDQLLHIAPQCVVEVLDVDTSAINSAAVDATSATMHSHHYR